ncbi:MAG TPA: LCP family protein [Thermomicrobiaceae bacterium]|nr:LCP family protein [Thermomicrobiaceae bacterium]
MPEANAADAGIANVTGSSTVPASRRLSAAAVRQARQSNQSGEGGGAGPPGQRTALAGDDDGRRRRSRLKITLITIPIVVLLLAGSIGGYLAYKAKHAYDRIFTESVPRPVFTVNAAGTPVIVPGATETVQLPDWSKKDRVNILLLGVDQRDTGEIPRSDTIIVVSINPVTKQVGMMSIPRDMKVEIPNHGEDKINAAYSIGSQQSITGPGLVRATIEYNFHITIHYTAVIDFKGFQQIVDTLGGVTLDVQAPIKDDQYPGAGNNYTRAYFHSGLQHMNGAAALEYARTRHDDNDFARGVRQQQVLMALRSQASALNLITKAPALLDDLGDTLKTDLPPSDALKLAKLGTEIKQSDIHSYSLLPAVTDQIQDGVDYLIPDWSKVDAVVKQMIPPPPATPVPTKTATPTPTATRSASPTPAASPTQTTPNLAARILVQNATLVNQLAADNAARLTRAGFTSVDTGQSPQTGQYPTSQVVVYNDDDATARAVAQDLNLPASSVKSGDPSTNPGYDIVVILGDDAPALGG